MTGLLVVATVNENVDGLGGGGAVYGDPIEVILQPDGTAGLDTFLDSNNPTTNSGTSNIVYVGSVGGGTKQRTWIEFDVSSIPANALIDDAILSLWEDSASDTAGVGDHDVNVHRVLKNVVEAQATWNIYSTGNNWTTAGCGAADDDRVSAISASLTMDATAAANFVSWTGAGLVADVQGWVNGTLNNYGWLLESPTAEVPTNACYNRFQTSDHVTASHRPKLTVTYREPA